jgi:hypothetical protein
MTTIQVKTGVGKIPEIPRILNIPQTTMFNISEV